MPQSSRAPPSAPRTSRGPGRLCPESLHEFSAGRRPTTTSVRPGRPEWASMCPRCRIRCRTSSVSSGAGGTPLPKAEPAVDAREAGVGLGAADVPRAPRPRGDRGETAGRPPRPQQSPGTSCTGPPRTGARAAGQPGPSLNTSDEDKETRSHAQSAGASESRAAAPAWPEREAQLPRGAHNTAHRPGRAPVLPARSAAGKAPRPPAGPHSPPKGERDAGTGSRTTPASSPRPPRLPPRRAAAARPGPSPGRGGSA